MPCQRDAVARSLRSFAFKGGFDLVFGVALEGDVSLGASGATRRKSYFKRDTLPGAYGQREDDSADRISISVPIRRGDRNAGVACGKSASLSFVSAHYHLPEIEGGRRNCQITSGNAAVRAASATATERESRRQN